MMQPQKRTKNRVLGQYYTPEYIVEYIISNTLGHLLKIANFKSIKVIDPSMGQGIFLKKSYEYFINYYRNKEKSCGNRVNSKIIAKNLYGLDIDTSQLNSDCDFLWDSNVKKCDSLISSWNTLFPEVSGGFDVIVGNPPWGVNVDYSSRLLRSYQTAVKQFDSWVLFLEKSLKNLRRGGRLGFVLPNTLLLNENYSTIRKIILESATIIKIVNLGDGWFDGVSQPSMIIILEKSKSTNANQIKVLDYVLNEQQAIFMFVNDSFDYKMVNQGQFINNSGYDFNIWGIGHEKILQKIEGKSVKPLKDFVTNARGVEINKKGKVIRCLECGWWNPPPKSEKICSNTKCFAKVSNTNPFHYIVSRESQKNAVPFLTGSHVNRYYLEPNYFLELGYNGVNYKESSIYTSPKLLLRKTGHNIQSVIDYNNCWTNQVVYIFKLRENSPISLESIMGILNSKLMYYYYYRKHADPNRKDFPHFTQKKFLKLPIKKPENGLEESMIRLVGQKARILQTLYQKKCLGDSNIDLESDLSLLEKEIDTLVFKLYGLSDKDIECIQDDVTNFLQIQG